MTKPIDPIYGFPLGTSNRKIAVFVIEVLNSNPNGDPDEGGNPRRLPNGYGIISPMKIKRMIRDYSKAIFDTSLYVEHGADLGEVQESYGCDPQKMIDDLWDVRVFGGALPRSGKVRGPVQINPAMSLEPITTHQICITRVAGKVEEVQKQASDEALDDGRDTKLTGTMGTFEVIPHALYVGTFTYNPIDGRKHNVSETDLETFFAAFIEAWEGDIAAQRTGVRLRRLYLVDVPGPRCTVSRQQVENRLSIKYVGEDNVEFASSFDEYEVTFDDSLDGLPPGATIHRWEDGPMFAQGELAAK